MQMPNRDLLVLSGKINGNPTEFELQVALLHDMLHKVEGIKFFCVANEVLDVSRNKLVTKEYLIHQIIRQPSLKPFVFICNKN